MSHSHLTPLSFISFYIHRRILESISFGSGNSQRNCLLYAFYSYARQTSYAICTTRMFRFEANPLDFLNNESLRVTKSWRMVLAIQNWSWSDPGEKGEFSSLPHPCGKMWKSGILLNFWAWEQKESHRLGKFLNFWTIFFEEGGRRLTSSKNVRSTFPTMVLWIRNWNWENITT